MYTYIHVLLVGLTFSWTITANIQPNVMLICTQMCYFIILLLIITHQHYVKIIEVNIVKDINISWYVFCHNLITSKNVNKIYKHLWQLYMHLYIFSRSLPDNFNESWYIFLSVCTTLFIWIAFLPTYFNAFYAYHKSALLALALILNGLVVLICLVGPKVYALFYIEDTDIKISDFSGRTSSSEVSRSTRSVSNVH